MKIRAINTLMFCANDALKHDVTFSEEENGWIIENERDGIVGNGLYADVLFALEIMEKITKCPVSLFTVTHNPYTHLE